MCLELTYRNSPSECLVDFSYLAVKDKMLVNKVFEDEESLNGICYGGEYIEEGYLWVRFENKDKEPVCTALINYADSEEWEGSLQQALTNISNDEELQVQTINNIMEMFDDAIESCGFEGTYIGEIINEAVPEMHTIFYKVVDFGMHLPSYDNLHPYYDT